MLGSGQRAQNLFRLSIQDIGVLAIRLGLAIVIGWIGLMKFTTYEASGISVFVRNSPILGWAYNILSVRDFSNMLGLVELAISLGLLLGGHNRRLAVLSSATAVGMFATTLSFMLTTPGTIEPSLGFPALSVVPGQFLVKDFVALGASVFLFCQALTQQSVGRGTPDT